MNAYPKDAKGPAKVAPLPSHGSHNALEEIAMNTDSDITNTALAARPAYTVEQHVADMEACGAYFRWSPEGVWQNMLEVDWTAFEACRVKTMEAGITTMDVWQHLESVSLNEVA